MAYLPQHRSEEVATKSDIADLKNDFTRFEDHLERIDNRLDSLHRTVLTSMIGLTTIFSFIVVAVAWLTA